MEKLKQFVTWLLKTVRNIGIYKGWPFILIAIGWWLIFGWSPVASVFFLGVAIGLSWTEIQKQVSEWWKRG